MEGSGSPLLSPLSRAVAPRWQVWGPAIQQDHPDKTHCARSSRRSCFRPSLPTQHCVHADGSTQMKGYCHLFRQQAFTSPGHPAEAIQPPAARSDPTAKGLHPHSSTSSSLQQHNPTCGSSFMRSGILHTSSPPQSLLLLTGTPHLSRRLCPMPLSCSARAGVLRPARRTG